MKSNLKLIAAIIVISIVSAYIGNKAFYLSEQFANLDTDIYLINERLDSLEETLAHRQKIAKYLIDHGTFVNRQISRTNINMANLKYQIEKRKYRIAPVAASTAGGD